MRFAYGTDYWPPAPIFEIRLGLPCGALQLGPVRALVDTGADTTVAPLALLRQLGARADDYRNLRSPWGELRRVPIYTVDIGIAELRIPAIDVAGVEHMDELILGRNVLNKLLITLDGPKQMLETF